VIVSLDLKIVLESQPFIQSAGGIYFQHPQRNRPSLLSPAIKQLADKICSDSAPLGLRQQINVRQIKLVAAVVNFDPADLGSVNNDYLRIARTETFTVHQTLSNLVPCAVDLLDITAKGRLAHLEQKF